MFYKYWRGAVPALFVALQVFPVWAQQNASGPAKSASTQENKHEAGLRLLRETANDLCAIPPLSGSSGSIELSGEAKARLSGALKKFADIGLQGAGRFQSSEYEGLLQKELAGELKNARDCKLKVFERLVDRLLPK